MTVRKGGERSMKNGIIFKHDLRSYLLASVLGVFAGLLVAFFACFPSDDLWGLAFFSSQTFGFWVFTCSLIALFSSKHYAAGGCVALYVYFMFYITGLYKRLAVVLKMQNTWAYFFKGFYEELSYGLLAAALCFALAFILWLARKDKPIFVLLRFAPLLVIAAEAIWLWLWVINQNCFLFMAIVDTLCAAAYLFIILKRFDNRLVKAKPYLVIPPENGSNNK